MATDERCNPSDPYDDSCSDHPKSNAFLSNPQRGDPMAVSAAQFQADVEAKVFEMSAPPPGTYAAPKIDWAKVKAAAAAAANGFEQIAPVVSGLLPAQYAAYVTLAATIIHGVLNQPAAA